MSQDIAFMRQALRLAARARGRTSPNPMVGAVIVRDGLVVGKGYHPHAGAPHAEVFALDQAGQRARGATLYVNLEPCSHHGRTPPCAEAIQEAGVSRVVAAIEDPNPLVSGKGLALLRQAGIQVEVGVCAQEARQLNEAFLTYITRKRPFVILKYAMTLDGKIATASGDARWVTGEKARAYVHRLRGEADAILVGIGTVLKDDPELTARRRNDKNPIRIILDSQARIPTEARVLQTISQAPTWIVTTSKASMDRIEALHACGAAVLVVEEDTQGRVDWHSLLRTLGEREIVSLLVEGGGTVHASALEAGVGDKVLAFIAPRIIGGTMAPTPVEGKGIDRMAEAIPLTDISIRRLGGDLLVQGYLRRIW